MILTISEQFQAHILTHCYFWTYFAPLSSIFFFCWTWTGICLLGSNNSRNVFKCTFSEFHWVFRIKVSGNYMFEVNNKNTKTKCEICSKLTIKTPERRQYSLASFGWVFFVNSEDISRLALFKLLTSSSLMPAGYTFSAELHVNYKSVSLDDFTQVTVR